MKRNPSAYRKIISVFMAVMLLSIAVCTVYPVKADDNGVTKVLLIGNSLTYSDVYNTMTVNYLMWLAEDGGHDLYLDYVAYDNECMETYADPYTHRGQIVRQAIRSEDWDYVILQQHTDHAVALYHDSLESMMIIGQYVQNNCSSAKILLNHTWPYYMTISCFGGYYSYYEQYYNMRLLYHDTAVELDCDVIHTADAFEEYDFLGLPTLYQEDVNHASLYGAFMDACCMYTKIFKESPSRSAYNTTYLDHDVIRTIKTIAYSCNNDLTEDPENESVRGGTAPEEPAEEELPEERFIFTDVTDSSKYFFGPVYWAAEEGIVKGYSDGTFRPGNICTRRELVIMLWRLAGRPETDEYGNAFTDPYEIFNDIEKYDTESATYAALGWASDEGIVRGFPDGGFHPEDPVTRKDTIIILYRFCGRPCAEDEDAASLDPEMGLSFEEVPFYDVMEQHYPLVSDTYQAILWSYKTQVAKGYEDGTFGIDIPCLREHIVTFLYRLC